jgi:predicted nucleotidyltransferase
MRTHRRCSVELLKQNRARIMEIAKRHGVTRIRVFGSVARGEVRPTSDLDLLVDVGPNPSPWFPGGLVADLEELLGMPVQVVTERGLNDLLRDHVLSEAIPL